MRVILLIPLLVLNLFLFGQPQFELSRNIYRIPYASGTSVRISNDHYSHDPQGRYDMVGQGGGVSCTPFGYSIVAAAAGVIRRIQDSYDIHGPDCSSNCENWNNYVWIEHANGEWSKYSHMMKNSTSSVAGLSVGDTVCAGTFLGYECDIGQASGPHLHFEVRRPNNPANVVILTSGGFMNDAVHLIPVIHSVPRHYFVDNDMWTASGSAYCPSSVIVPAVSTGNGVSLIYFAGTSIITDNHSISYQGGSNGLLQAGGSITIGPGFHAEAGSVVQVKINNCNTTPFPGGCN